jgi:hypothetical protein
VIAYRVLIEVDTRHTEQSLQKDIESTLPLGFNGATIAYGTLSRNSNAYASELLQSVGIVPTYPGGNVFGWGTNLIDALFIGPVSYQR